MRSIKERGWITLAALVPVALLVVSVALVSCGDERIGAQAVRERIAINTGQDSYVHSGADIRWYSDGARLTEVARIDGAGGAQFTIPTAQATATPGLYLNNNSVADSFVIAQAGTPVFSVAADGTTSDCIVSSTSGIAIAQPTAAATATPALRVNSLAAGSKLVEVQDASTPVFSILNGGAVSRVGDDSLTGDLSITGELAVAQATAAATATPAAVINSSAAGSALLEVRKAATPQVQVQNDGDVDFLTGDVQVAAGALRVVAPTAQPTATPAAAIASTGVGALLDISGSALEYQFDRSAFDLQSNYIEADLNTEHLMLPSVITATVAYTPASGTIATIGDGEIWVVHAVFAKVTTNFDCTGNDCTVVIGDGNDANGFLDLADAELQAADTEGTGWAAGWQGLIPATQGVYIDAAAGSTYFIYAPSGAPETIDYAVGGTDPAAGLLDVYVIYTRIQ